MEALVNLQFQNSESTTSQINVGNSIVDDLNNLIR